MKIAPEPTPRKVLYPSIVAAALASCQQEQEQALSGAPPMPPLSVQPGKNAGKSPVKTKTGKPCEPQRTIGRQRVGGAFNRVFE